MSDTDLILDPKARQAAYEKAAEIFVNWNATTMQHARNKVDAIITAYLRSASPPPAEPVALVTEADIDPLARFMADNVGHGMTEQVRRLRVPHPLRPIVTRTRSGGLRWGR